MTVNDRPLRVLHLTSRSAEGGVSRYLYDLGRRMQSQGHDVWFAGARGDWHDLFEQSGLPWIEMPLHGGPGSLLASVARLGRLLESHPFDVLHSHYRKSMIVARCLGTMHDVPSVTTLHLTHVPMSPLHRVASCFGDCVHAPSAAAQQWLIDVAKVDAGRIRVIPHGVDVDHFTYQSIAAQHQARHTLGLPQDATLAAFVGRVTGQKNPQWLIELMAAARDRLPALRLLIMGGGDLEAPLREEAAARGLADRVHWMAYGDPRQVYAACDALLLPSGFEGFALVVTEAMSMGRAVLRTDTAGAKEQIRPGITGQVVPVDRAGFVETALTFLTDRDRLRVMGEAAAAHVRQSLTLEQQVERTVALYRALCRY